MKCRQCINGHLVWFGKYNQGSDANPGYVKGNNYAEGDEAVAESLNQRLSIIKSELWYQVNYGIPLLEKIKSPAIFDSVICDIITSHPEVASLLSYSSKVDQGVYSFLCSIKVRHGDILTISNTYSI